MTPETRHLIAEMTAAIRANTARIDALTDKLVRAFVEADLARLNAQARRELRRDR